MYQPLVTNILATVAAAVDVMLVKCLNEVVDAREAVAARSLERADLTG